MRNQIDAGELTIILLDLIAVHSNAGGKPTEEQLDAISYQSGRAVAAIAQALNGASAAAEATVN